MDHMDKIKNYSIFVLLALIVGLAALTLFGGNSNKNQEEEQSQQYQEQIDQLTAQLQDGNFTSDDDSIEKQNVCTNFLKDYYSVNHSKSQNSTLPSCKKYMSKELFESLSPKETETEYSNDEIDVDYSSNVSVGEIYLNTDSASKLLVNCTINKNINGMKSSNEYFVLFSFCKVENEWLIDSFELISVQGG